MTPKVSTCRLYQPWPGPCELAYKYRAMIIAFASGTSNTARSTTTTYHCYQSAIFALICTKYSISFIMSYIEPKVNQVAIVRDGELVINITVKLSLAGITVNVGNEVQSNENGAEGQPAPCQTHSRTKQDEHHEPLSTLPKGSNDVSPTPADDTAPHEPQNGVPTADTDKQKTPIHIVEGQPVCNGTNSGYCKEVPEGQNTIPREEGERTLGQPVNCGTHSDVVSSEAGKKGNESLLSPPKDGNYAGPVCNGTNSG